MDDKTIYGFFSDPNVTTRARARHVRARMVLLMALLALSSTGGAQELIVNGDFDSDLSGWTIFGGTPAPAWASFDHADGPSGSVLLTNTALDAGAHSMQLSQCFDTPPAPGTYYFSADGYIPAGQSAGRLFVEVSLYDGSGCTPPGGGVGHYLPATTGVWVHASSSIDVDADPIVQPASMKLVIGIEKTPAGGSFQGYIDAVRLIYDPIFIDDFEPPPTLLTYPAVSN